jgi:hypothetical protein
MLHSFLCMLLALISAGVTDVGAHPAQLLAGIPLHAKHRGSGIANHCAFQVKLNTGFQHRYILFV